MTGVLALAGPVLTGPVLAGGILAEGSSDGGEFTAVSVSPGLPGFITMFLIAIATLLLILDMTRRIRRSQARERVEARMRAEEAERAAHPGTATGEDAAGGVDGRGREDRPER